MSTQKQVAVRACYEHALRVIRDMQHDIERGSSPLLACGMALVSMQTFRLTRVPQAHFESKVGLLLGIESALTVAIRFYEDPGVITAIGNELAEAHKQRAMQILEQLTRGTEPPLFIQSAN